MDNDGDLANGHSYIKGIYDLWKSRNPDALVHLQSEQQHLPQLWSIEYRNDLKIISETSKAATERAYTDSVYKTYKYD